jgi:hypothetical protein
VHVTWGRAGAPSFQRVIMNVIDDGHTGRTDTYLTPAAHTNLVWKKVPAWDEWEGSLHLTVLLSTVPSTTAWRRDWDHSPTAHCPPYVEGKHRTPSIRTLFILGVMFGRALPHLQGHNTKLQAPLTPESEHPHQGHTQQRPYEAQHSYLSWSPQPLPPDSDPRRRSVSPFTICRVSSIRRLSRVSQTVWFQATQPSCCGTPELLICMSPL